MRLATFNCNSVRSRLDTVLRWLVEKARSFLKHQLVSFLMMMVAGVVLLAALNGDRAGIGVFDDIIQPFLTDAEQRHALAFTQRRFINSPVEMADNAAAFQLHLAHQGAYRLLK